MASENLEISLRYAPDEISLRAFGQWLATVAAHVQNRTVLDEDGLAAWQIRLPRTFHNVPALGEDGSQCLLRVSIHLDADHTPQEREQIMAHLSYYPEAWYR